MALIGPNKNGRCYDTSSINHMLPPNDELKPHPCFPSQNEFYSPYIPLTTTTIVSAYILEPETITFKYKDKTFGIDPKNKEIADKLITLQLKDWITYLQYEDDGIVQLVKFLIGMKYKESTGSDLYTLFGTEKYDEIVKQLAKQMKEAEDKIIMDLLLNKKDVINGEK
jgi:hypothetical protein